MMSKRSNNQIIAYCRSITIFSTNFINDIEYDNTLSIDNKII
jgi:hypothetical protein